ncbi:MAG: hypothetical protein ACLVGD_01695 [Monoglobales bacterium]
MFVSGIGSLGLLTTIANIYIIKNQLFDIQNYLHFDLNLLAVFAYIITFISLLNRLDIKRLKTINILVSFAVVSLILLYLSNDIILFTSTFIIYVVLLSIKLFSLHTKKYNRIAVGIIGVTLICFTLTLTVAQPYLLDRMMTSDTEVAFMQERLNNSNFIGTANIVPNELTQYYYMNFSNYSFIYLIEQYGKLFGIFIITIFALLSISIIVSCKNINDEFGKFLIIGIGCFIFIQMLVSIFTLLGIINIEMINIPFITHNDASIILYMIAISLIISIYGRKNLCSKEALNT